MNTDTKTRQLNAWDKNTPAKQGWALGALTEAASVLGRASSVSLLAQEVCGAITSQSPYVLAWVGKALDDPNKSIKVLGGAGEALAYMQDIVVSWSDTAASGAGPGGIAVRSEKSNVIDDSESNAGFTFWKLRARKYGIRSVIGCPIPAIDGSHPFGVLLVYSKEPNAFGESEIQLFESLAKEIGFGIRSIERQCQLDDQIHEREQVQVKLADALRSTIEAMSKAMEWRDPYTAGHQKRVALIAEAIAKKLGWSEDRTQAIYMAAMVHDIGKVAVPAEILTKPSKLTALEMQMVQGHVEAGYQILKDIPFPWPIADMVRQHHERLDGSGYPNKLISDQICEEARVLAVADIIEAMSTHRPYRAARGLDSAMNEVRSEAGMKLDSRIVDAAVGLFHEGKLQHLILSEQP